MGGFLKPCDRMRNALSRPAVNQPDIFLHERLGGKSVVVEIEAASQSPTTIQNEGTDYGPSGVTVLFEYLCDGAELLRERLPPEVLNTILEGIHTSQNGGV